MVTQFLIPLFGQRVLLNGDVTPLLLRAAASPVVGISNWMRINDETRS